MILLARVDPTLFKTGFSLSTRFLDERWFDIMAWGGILVVTAYAMGTLYMRHENRLNELRYRSSEESAAVRSEAIETMASSGFIEAITAH